MSREALLYQNEDTLFSLTDSNLVKNAEKEANHRKFQENCGGGLLTAPATRFKAMPQHQIYQLISNLNDRFGLKSIKIMTMQMMIKPNATH